MRGQVGKVAPGARPFRHQLGERDWNKNRAGPIALVAIVELDRGRAAERQRALARTVAGTLGAHREKVRDLSDSGTLHFFV